MMYVITLFLKFEAIKYNILQHGNFKTLEKLHYYIRIEIKAWLRLSKDLSPEDTHHTTIFP